MIGDRFVALGVTVAASFVSSFVATGLVGSIATRRGLLDAPEAERRLHRVPTPRLGGVGILVGLGVGWLTLHLLGAGWPPTWWEAPVEHWWDFVGPQWTILIGVVLFFLVGLLDDIRRPGISPVVKLGLQAAAAAVPVVLGARFDGVTEADPWPPLEFGSLEAAMTVLWFVAVVNLLTFMDGIDWIAAGTAGVVLLSRGLVETPIEAAVGSGFFLAAAGATLGFAIWNRPPARIFMGDGGSHLLGFVAAAAACSMGVTITIALPGLGYLVFSSGHAWAVTAAALLPAVVDVAEALVHKARNGIPLAQAHHDHLYQRLVKAGSGAGVVAIRYTLLAAAGAVLAGPVATRFGVWAALLPGAAIMTVHLWTGARAVKDVPRLKAS